MSEKLPQRKFIAGRVRIFFFFLKTKKEKVVFYNDILRIFLPNELGIDTL